jgi:hypothetical protein
MFYELEAGCEGSRFIWGNFWQYSLDNGLIALSNQKQRPVADRDHITPLLA